MFWYFLPCNDETERVRQEGISGVPGIYPEIRGLPELFHEIVCSFPQKQLNYAISQQFV